MATSLTYSDKWYETAYRVCPMWGVTVELLITHEARTGDNYFGIDNFALIDYNYDWLKFVDNHIEYLFMLSQSIILQCVDRSNLSYGLRKALEKV